VRTFIREHPEVNLHVTYAAWNSIYAAVTSGEMDLGVVACPERHRSIEIIPLASEELVVVVPPDHPLAKRQKIAMAQLDGEKFVAFERNIPTRRHIDRILRRHGVSAEMVMEFDNVELLKRAVMVGAGVSILPRGNVEKEAAYGDLAFVRVGGLSDQMVRPVAIIRRRGKSPGPAERTFLGLLRSKT
jgi:DNA-binding transcriptional LysR family regulator